MALWRENPGISPILVKALAARGLTTMAQLAGPLDALHPYQLLKGANDAAQYLADCIQAGQQLCIIADYDCDGATACAIAVRGLRAFHANVSFLVPDRKVHGYGLTPSIVNLAAEQTPRPEVIITVDNGIASHDGVARAAELGLEVLVTDHHLPSKLKPLPAARHIVDPAQPGCTFPSKNLAGCGVIWYVLWALQAVLHERGMAVAPGFDVQQLLPLVAVGTVADVVTLDHNNRILVQAGLDRIRAGDHQTFAGIDALATAGFGNTCNPRELITTDIAFGIGPRINAAGRMTVMDPGIQCLITDGVAEARVLAKELSALNQVRQDTELDMAQAAFDQALTRVTGTGFTIVVHDPAWHAGVIGIVAGRIKERLHRPTFVLTTDPGTYQVKGSGRSIPGVHLKDLLDWVDKNNPGLLLKFGGHAMAAGVTLRPGGLAPFAAALELAATELLDPAVLQQTLDVDGELPGSDLTVQTAKELRGPAWGQGFPEPAFQGMFQVQSAKLAKNGKASLTMKVMRDGAIFDAIRYRHAGEPPEEGAWVYLVYKLALTRDRKGKETLKLLVDFMDGPHSQ